MEQHSADACHRPWGGRSAGDAVAASGGRPDADSKKPDIPVLQTVCTERLELRGFRPACGGATRRQSPPAPSGRARRHGRRRRSRRSGRCCSRRPAGQRAARRRLRPLCKGPTPQTPTLAARPLSPASPPRQAPTTGKVTAGGQGSAAAGLGALGCHHCRQRAACGAGSRRGVARRRR